MISKATLKLAEQLLDRFFRDAIGRTGVKLDIYFTLEDMGVAFEKAQPALEYLASRGLIQLADFETGYLTEMGVEAIAEEKDIKVMPKHEREWVRQAPSAPAAAPAVETPRTDPSRPRPATPRIVIASEAGQPMVVELTWRCTLGRSDENTVPLDDRRASKLHAEIRYAGDHYVLKDMGSANGTMLNGEYVELQALRHGDEFIVGRTSIIYECPEVISEPAGVPELAPSNAPSARVEEHAPPPSASSHDPEPPLMAPEPYPPLPLRVQPPRASEGIPSPAAGVAHVSRHREHDPHAPVVRGVGPAETPGRPPEERVHVAGGAPSGRRRGQQRTSAPPPAAPNPQPHAPAMLRVVKGRPIRPSAPADHEMPRPLGTPARGELFSIGEPAPPAQTQRQPSDLFAPRPDTRGRDRDDDPLGLGLPPDIAMLEAAAQSNATPEPGEEATAIATPELAERMRAEATRAKTGSSTPRAPFEDDSAMDHATSKKPVTEPATQPEIVPTVDVARGLALSVDPTSPAHSVLKGVAALNIPPADDAARTADADPFAPSLSQGAAGGALAAARSGVQDVADHEEENEDTGDLLRATVPVAADATGDLETALEEDPTPAPPPSRFVQTLLFVREYVESADTTDRRELLAAIDLLKEHPVVRSAIDEARNLES